MKAQPTAVIDNVRPLRTPDGRYIVVRGRLWRAANPNLPTEMRSAQVKALMTARKAVGRALERGDSGAEAAARAAVDQAKHALGERGPPWWSDGSPDLNRRLVRNTCYAGWYAAMSDGTTREGRRAS